MEHPSAKKVGVLARTTFGNPTHTLWRCSTCGGYFTAEHSDDGSELVGLVPVDVLYRQNRSVNRVRRRWASARERGDTCTCGFRAYRETSDQLHRVLPESPDEGSAFGWWDDDETTE